FLPAGWVATGEQMKCLYDNKSSIPDYNTNGYWGSTELSSSTAKLTLFLNGNQVSRAKNSARAVRCARNYT
ncbi:MAG: hypothetical protein QNK11_01575, partial [Legionella sp.]|nr:hypothetical protein [Legionella sp.]